MASAPTRIDSGRRRPTRAVSILWALGHWRFVHPVFGAAKKLRDPEPAIEPAPRECCRLALVGSPTNVPAQRRVPAAVAAPPLSAATPRAHGQVPSTGSPTLACARAAQFPADAPDLPSLIARMRNTAPAAAAEL
ncbi:hypothetical protein ABT039_22890 [Streptomyces lasiicapitis]|uniref:hypothetical protein n=1 Tax=Streptomyces lasiicapitis TaxID=1923961 RepID=UPI0033217D9E